MPVETVVIVPVSRAENEGANASLPFFIPAKARSTAVNWVGIGDASLRRIDVLLRLEKASSREGVKLTGKVASGS
jgi:hypothetical protein